jgi:hypothetical protein
MTETTPTIHPTSRDLSAADHWDHIKARLGIRRETAHRVTPGLYQLGNPDPQSPVFVTANYTLSFDALRSALQGTDAYIMVLNTKGINVWCAAGKGSFGTFELVRRIEQTQLAKVVAHRTLILPQLSATGVSAHEVKKQSGFRVEYGPVRAEDIPQYLLEHKATPAMRRVRFNIIDRLTLIPVDLIRLIPLALLAAAFFWLLGSWIWSFAALAAFLAGEVLFPILLPWLPSRDFTTKGWFLGLICAIPLAIWQWFSAGGMWWQKLMASLPLLLLFPPITAYITMNFTGSSTFTSVSGVKREIFAYIRPMAWVAGFGLLLGLVLAGLRLFGGLHV